MTRIFSFFLPLSMLAFSVLAMPTNEEVEGLSINKRQYINPFGSTGTCCRGDCAYANVGDGNPHQDYYHEQLTDPMRCNGDSCTPGYGTATTIGWSAGGTANVGSFFSGGFSVTKSFTTSNQYSCTAQPGHTTCIWVSLAHTAYTVQIKSVDEVNPSCSNQPLQPFVIEAPNDNNAGGSYYCETDDACGNLGDNYWCYGTDCPDGSSN